MKAIGIDLGGSKIEVQLFDDDWQVAERHRVITPDNYADLIDSIVSQISWADSKVQSALPVGVGAPGLINPDTGLALMANVCAMGQPLPADIQLAIERPVTYVNDCRALALSEVVFGAGKGYRVALSMVLGTGIGGGIAVEGHLLKGATNTSGEFGHISVSPFLMDKYKLPLIECGCGRVGCVETYVAGPGMTRIAQIITGEALTPLEISKQKSSHPPSREVWEIWCELAADLLRTLTLTVDPEIIILAGGLSKIEGIADDLFTAANRAQIGDFGIAPIVLAQGGDSSGARGAAYAAYQENQARAVRAGGQT